MKNLNNFFNMMFVRFNFMKTKFRFTFLLLLAVNLSFAQQQNTDKLIRKAKVLSLGAGLTNPSSTTLSGANLSKGLSFNAVKRH